MLDIEKIVAGATPAEKVALLGGKGLWWTHPLERLGVPSILMTDGTHGLRYSEAQIERGQLWGKREVTGCAVPAADEAELSSSPDWLPFGHSRPATCFPNGSGLACSWDPELIREMGEALAEECLQMGVSVLLGPGINIRRTPLAGRAYEYYSEDPFLTGVIAVAMIEGLQSRGVGACVKHFACNNSEFQRTQMDSVVDERALREIYLRGFERVIKLAKPWLVMSSYNRLNGVQASEHEWLLTRVLREEWAYEGAVISDWYGVKDRPKSLLAGNDLSMPEYAVDRRELLAAVENGSVPVAKLDRAVARLLELVNKAEAQRQPGFEADFKAHHQLAQRIARESIVLLKNDGGLLPIAPDQPKRLLVVGPTAATPVIQGSGCATTTPWMLDRPLDEMVEVAGNTLSITYAAGCAANGVRDEAALGEAVEAAAKAEIVVLFASTPIGEDGENGDRRDLFILPAQDELIERLAAVQPNLVVVLANSDAVVMPWLPKVRALIETFYSGQGMGRAVAEILFGLANPCGRLTTTVPNCLEETPAYLHYPGENQRHLYSEGIYVGYRYYDRRKLVPRFPFGFGLSYTRFRYERMTLSGTVFAEDETIAIDVSITNVGARAGKEVVQIYVEPPPSRLARAPRELKAFAKRMLAPGETASVTMALPVAELAYYDPAQSAWVVEPGRYRILAGSSSRDAHLRAEITVQTAPSLPPLTDHSSLVELLAHQDAFARICALMARKSGRPLAEVRELLEINAADLFTNVYMALTTTFELDISREECRAALYGV